MNGTTTRSQVTALCVMLVAALLLAAPGRGQLALSDPPRESETLPGLPSTSAFEPPTLRDPGSVIADLATLKDGETRRFGSRLLAIRSGDAVFLSFQDPAGAAKSTDPPGTPNGKESCNLIADRCLALVHRDGTVEMWFSRSAVCRSNWQPGQKKLVSDHAGVERIQVKHRRNGKCMEDLRITTQPGYGG